MFRQTVTKSVTLLLLLTAAILYGMTTGYYGRELLTEVAILSILVISLDLVAGYAGMISLCHGALFGIGAYAFAIITAKAELSPVLGMVAALAAAAGFALFVGAVTARTRGIFFIMASLAFGQLAYVWIFDNAWLGGDDGLPGVARLDLSALGVDIGSSRGYALFCVAMAVLAYGLAAFVLRSGFGRALVGIRSNEARMLALGLPVRRHKALAFATSGLLAGLAGALAAQHIQFVSPELLFWTVSGEALVVVILGGLGTLVGPVVGAVIFVFLKHEVSGWTDHWHIVVGLVLITAVLAGSRGIYGEIERRISRRSRPELESGR